MSPSFGRRLRRLIGAACAVVVASAVIATPAAADPFGLNTEASGSGAIPDNLNHVYCFTGSGLDTAWRIVINGRMQNLVDQTNYTVVLNAVCDPLIDIRFSLDSSLPTGVLGRYNCTGFNTGDDGVDGTGDEECETSTIRFNPTLLNTTRMRTKTACHEIGHSVGLAHGDDIMTFWNDCMKSGSIPPDPGFVFYNEHHITHANARVKANR